MATASIALTARNGDLAALRELVAAAGLQLEARGWFYSTCTISGPPHLVESFRPTLKRWQETCESADAW